MTHSAITSHGGVPDMTSLSEIDEHGINLNLQIRYKNDDIYTYSGTILVAVNPYKDLPIFDLATVHSYHNSKISALPPHVFALAESAFKSLQNDVTNQSLVISGESGAGKTESTKFILQYLCSVTANISTWVQQQILEANTILEAFGNAKTIRNDNSSRFGRFMQVCFDSKYKIKGCVIQDYLLEQSRITNTSFQERNYHVFYQLLSAGLRDKNLSSKYHLLSPINYSYLNTSGCEFLEGVNDADKFDGLRLAFEVVQIPTEMTEGIFAVLSAILWLGNLSFEDTENERASLSAEDRLIALRVSNLLELNQRDLELALCCRQINIRGNVTEIPLKYNEAKENRHAMSKALYSRTFAWLVTQLNKCTNPGKESTTFIGILDIFGFENFTTNSFEQLCINYTNEKLHKFFNHYVFALEQNTYKIEEIEYSHISFTDNSECVELLDKPPKCILKLLAEQCHMPGGCDAAYLTNITSEFESHPDFIKGDDRRKWDTEFGIRHYAGTVTYSVFGFVDKNRDSQQDVFFDILAKSNNNFVLELIEFKDLLSKVAALGESTHKGEGSLSKGTVKRMMTNKGKPTVSDAFRLQLQVLLEVLQSTNPWYVRCIKPNKNKAKNTYDYELVYDQLKYLGMLEIIRIRKQGFPVHFLIQNFYYRYKCLIPKVSKSASGETKDAVRTLLTNTFNLLSQEWQIGKTKVFLRSIAHESLETRRNEIINRAATLLQKLWKGQRERRKYLRIIFAIYKIQKFYYCCKYRRDFCKKRRAVIVIQSYLRGMFSREVAAALREAKSVEEDRRRLERLEEERRVKVRERVEINNEGKVRGLERKDSFASLADIDEGEAEYEVMKLSQLAEQLNPKLNEQETGVVVDLDQLFHFLSGEIQEVKVSELESNKKSKNISESDSLYHHRNSRSPSPPPPPSPVPELCGIIGKPTLPEPEGPPPPPPSSSSLTNGFLSSKKKYEPIYESIIPPRPEPLGGESFENSETIRLNGVSSSTNDYGFGNKESRRLLRIKRKLEKIQEFDDSKVYNKNESFDLLEFAENYFTEHEKSPSGTLRVGTLKRSKDVKAFLSKSEMISYYKGNSIPNSHIHMFDPENVNIAIQSFKDLCKYARGDLKEDSEILTIQRIIRHGILREELRDEIIFQCVRQINGNPNSESEDRLWLLLCLIVVSFSPSKSFFKYFVSFLKDQFNKESESERKMEYVQWCLDNTKHIQISSRKNPPSTVEITAMRRLGTIVIRFFFLDGRTKALDVHSSDTASDALIKLSEKIGLQSLEGWALFESVQGIEKHIMQHTYLYDIISEWEIQSGSSQKSSSQKNSSHGPLKKNQASGDNRFFLKKRLFTNTREIPSDPIEVSLLYAQAVHSVVISDEYPTSEKVALQLAGLQAQVTLGQISPLYQSSDLYSNVRFFLPNRILRSRFSSENDWSPIIAEAHAHYGFGKAEVVAKVWYLSCVMQYPLYGVTFYSVTYRGYWSHGSNILLGVNAEGILFVKPENKFILFEFPYGEIQSILTDSSESFITLTLTKSSESRQSLYVFETLHKNSSSSLIHLVSSYCPTLANPSRDSEFPKRRSKQISNEDRLRLHKSLVSSRRALIDENFLRKPCGNSITGSITGDENFNGNGSNFFKNTLRKWSVRKMEKFRGEAIVNEKGVNGNENEEDMYEGFNSTYWSFTKTTLPGTLSKMDNEADEILALEVFTLLRTYAGLILNKESISTSSSSFKEEENEDHIELIQSVLEKAMRKDEILNELFLQLIKQTTNHPEPNSRVNLRHWSLIALASSVILPIHPLVKNYLLAHLKKCSGDFGTEEGKYARFAEKCFHKTLGTRRRIWPPSKTEIRCTINRRPIYARFHFMDGQFHAIEFDPSATAEEVLKLVKAKIGLRESALGFAIYEVLGNQERSLLADEKVADVMSKWEKYRSSGNGSGAASKHSRHHMFLFKKHLFLDEYIDLKDPVEKELLYYQVLCDLRSDRFPVTDMEAVMLCALRAQIELGDYSSGDGDYRQVLAHCLPPRLLSNIQKDHVGSHHQSLMGINIEEAKQAFLNLIQCWPLYKATLFDVTQSFTSNWPKTLWLAIDQKGVHLLEFRSRNVLTSFEYGSILDYSPSINHVLLITGNEKKQSKIIVTTHQSYQISNLIREYIIVLSSGTQSPRFSS